MNAQEVLDGFRAVATSIKNPNGSVFGSLDISASPIDSRLTKNLKMNVHPTDQIGYDNGTFVIGAVRIRVFEDSFRRIEATT